VTIDKEERTQFKLYDLKDLKELLSVSDRSLYTYIEAGKLKAVKIGGKWKVSEGNLKKFING